MSPCPDFKRVEFSLKYCSQAITRLVTYMLLEKHFQAFHAIFPSEMKYFVTYYQKVIKEFGKLTKTHKNQIQTGRPNPCRLGNENY
jgi:hypothetical protein